MNRKEPVFLKFRFPVICGIKHSGKSTCGKLTAEMTGLPFRDLDTEIERLYRERYGTAASCREIYRNNGADAFRALETEAAVRIAAQEPSVTAAGGGLCDNPQAWNILKEAGAFFVYLDEPEERLFTRITAGGLPPFLAGGDPKALFHKLYGERDTFYRSRCDAVLPHACPEPAPRERAEKLVAILTAAGKGEKQ